MKLLAPVPVGWIAEFTGALLLGDTGLMATGINEIHKVRPGDISFVDLEKYYRKCLASEASIIFIDKKTACPPGKALLVVKDPFSAYVSLVNYFHPFEPSDRMIAESARIGKGTILQPQVFLGPHVRIGAHCLIHPQVTIYDHCEIGDRVIIHAGTVLGADALYYKRRPERQVQYDKLESCGRVIIEDDVEIGANCTIDRGVSGDTIIGRGSKLDNLVHVGHGTIIGSNCLLAAHVAIAGKVIMGNNVTLLGQVGIAKDLRIGEGVTVLSKSGVASDLEAGRSYFGNPAIEARERQKELVWIKRIPQIWKKVME